MKVAAWRRCKSRDLTWLAEISVGHALLNGLTRKGYQITWVLHRQGLR